MMSTLIIKMWPFVLILVAIAWALNVAERRGARRVDTGACGWPSPDQEFGRFDDI